MSTESSQAENNIDIPHVPKFSNDEVVNAYLNSLVDMGVEDSDTIAGQVSYYTDERPLGERIDPLIDELKRRIVPSDKVSERVLVARDLLERIADQLAPVLKETETAMFLFGSGVYDDPHNLDSDIWFVTRKETKANSNMVEILDRSIDSVWEKVVGKYVGSDVSLSTTEDLEKFREVYENKDLEYIRNNIEGMDATSGKFSVCFTGIPLFTPSPEFIPDLQMDIRKFAESNPLIAGSIQASLGETLAIRKARAEEKGIDSA